MCVCWIRHSISCRKKIIFTYRSTNDVIKNIQKQHNNNNNIERWLPVTVVWRKNQNKTVGWNDIKQHVNWWAKKKKERRGDYISIVLHLMSTFANARELANSHIYINLLCPIDFMEMVVGDRKKKSKHHRHRIKIENDSSVINNKNQLSF